MKPTPLLAAVAALTLAPAAAAQASFDLILPADFVLQDQVGQVTSRHFGILVNTGTEPLVIQDWQYAHFHVSSSEALEWIEFTPSWASSGSFVLLPGEASGVDDPAYRALLTSNETFVPGMFGALYARTDGVEDQTTDVTMHIEFAGQRIRSEYSPTFGAPTDPNIEVQTVQRWSSQAATPSIRTTAAGCELPGQGPIGLGVYGDGDQVGGHIGRYSDLPFVGNDRLGLQMGSFLDTSYAGSPWVVFLEAPGVTYDVLGCELVGFLHPLASGLVVDVHAFAFIPSVPLPIPNNANLVGKSVALQTVLLSTAAENGLFAATNAIELTFLDPLQP